MIKTAIIEPVGFEPAPLARLQRTNLERVLRGDWNMKACASRKVGLLGRPFVMSALENLLEQDTCFTPCFIADPETRKQIFCLFQPYVPEPFIGDWTEPAFGSWITGCRLLSRLLGSDGRNLSQRLPSPVISTVIGAMGKSL